MLNICLKVRFFFLLLNFESDEYLFESKIFVLLLNFESDEYLFESKIFVLLLNFERFMTYDLYFDKTKR